jgi:hypothetical protein
VAAPYEPNDSVAGATGPLFLNQPIGATLETETDADFYFFYVTSQKQAQTTLTLANLGGGSQSSDIQAIVFDNRETPVGGVSFVGDGESRSLALVLEPKKYFVSVSPNTGFGDSYNLTGSGGSGAFGSYSEIAAKCSAAGAVVAKAQRRLRRAQAKLQRTTARKRRTLFSDPRERRRARRAQRQAMNLTAKRRRELREARASRQPWCSIPR